MPNSIGIEEKPPRNLPPNPFRAAILIRRLPKSMVENRRGIREPQCMTWTRILAAAGCAAILCVGCSERETTVSASGLRSLPTQAQPRLPTMKLYVGPSELRTEVARRPREIMTGMMFRTNVVDGDAMLFVLSRPDRAAFWMTNCPVPLSCAYIDPDGIIREIHAMEPHNTNSIVAASDNILFVLETHAGWFDRNNVRTGMLVRTENGSLVGTFFEVKSR
jgi:uncharacterized membrane protein (UPF0127 family)